MGKWQMANGNGPACRLEGYPEDYGQFLSWFRIGSFSEWLADSARVTFTQMKACRASLGGQAQGQRDMEPSGLVMSAPGFASARAL
jgi:hypothetical protein